MPAYNARVFLNVPFDRRYRKLLDALVFAVHDCGFFARCALETEDGSQVRVEKLFAIIGDCRYGIHDLSRTTLDSASRLPRFNMPLELGIFLGAKRFGDPRQRQKSALILDRDRFRYQICCSDIAGQDIRAHNNDVSQAIRAVRDWLQASVSSHQAYPGGAQIAKRYYGFRLEFPAMCHRRHLDPRDLTFRDFRTMVVGWLDENAP